MNINSLGENAIQVRIDGEDYSLADIVHEELLKERHVKFAGVAPPHPLLKTLLLQVHTDGSDPNKALKDAVRVSQEKVTELLSIATKTFPDAIRISALKSETTPQV